MMFVEEMMKSLMTEITTWAAETQSTMKFIMTETNDRIAEIDFTRDSFKCEIGSVQDEMMLAMNSVEDKLQQQ